MSDNVETMAYYGVTPWHHKGQRLANPATAAEAISAARLDWEVQLRPVCVDNERYSPIPNHFAVCRTDKRDDQDGGYLAMVGKNYRPLQNREAFSFLDPVVGSNGAVYHTAGSLRDGKQIWLLAKLPGEIRIIGDDIAEKYLLLSNSHDGSSSVRIIVTPIRVVCQNTLNLALQRQSGLWIRHNSEVARRVGQAHKLLGIVDKAYSVVGQKMQAMAKVPMLNSYLSEYIGELIPVKTGTSLQRPDSKRRDRIRELFETGIGNDMPGVRGTLWAAFNAVTQWVDRESFSKRCREPLRSIWFGDGASLKARAFNLADKYIQHIGLN